MRKLINVEELAELLGVSKSWIYERTRMAGPETIPHLKLGKYLRFDPNSPAFIEWLKGHEILPKDLEGFPSAGLYSPPLERQSESGKEKS